MKQIDDLAMSQNQTDGLNALKAKLFQQFPVEKVILYGSYARGEADLESDIDLLILTKKILSRTERHQITDTVFDINLQYDTNFSSLVVDRLTWEQGLISIMPFHDEVLHEGIRV
ncbi:MAG: nucleotidyltransferase domain-containing protein [SAR324 cluster bacterium]|nr:nucleotidyltransferase domain-containing protein [SAR324 cluster bacterium]